MILQPKEADTGASLELWGGHECTVNRVGDVWFDQTARSGHEERVDDLAMFADLGIRKLRYPALWERMCGEGEHCTDFRWTDERLPEIQRLGMAPILTLCHHGSGPGHTSLIDDSFAQGLAHHAGAIAKRYPWVQDYTPVNEPLTTARFSALYGFWYPHTRDETAFWTALLNETDATRLAMRAIREVNPNARLVQTDDLGFCHATAPLQAEADFQNHRRWMGWDLLCGMVVPGHALWDRLVARGFEHRLRAIADDPCPPDVIGINHYLSSERLMDHRVELHGARAFADRCVGRSNGVEHVDVDAARHIPDQVIGIAGLIEQAWQRYRRPIAVTECHLGSTRDDQVRWFIDVWSKAQELRERGIDVHSVTAWSLLGSYDWNRMVTRWVGHYEPGVFDIRGGEPRPTLMARVLRELALGRTPQAPGLQVTGWWHEHRRKGLHGRTFQTKPGPRSVRAPRPLLVVSDGGELGRVAVEACETRGLHYIVAQDDRPWTVRMAHPWAVFDARPGKSDAESLSSTCQQLEIPAAIIVSPDHIEEPMPPGVLAITTGSIFTVEKTSLAQETLDQLAEGKAANLDSQANCDQVYAPSLVDTVLDLLLDGVTGAIDLRPKDCRTVGEFAKTLALLTGLEPDSIGRSGQQPAGGFPETVTYLPPTETMLERFVCDRNAAHRYVKRANPRFSA